MRIFVWGTYDTSKPRTRILLEGLRRAGAEVSECHADIWSGVRDKSQVRGLGRRAALALRWLLSYPRLAWRLLRVGKPDAILVGFPGVLDILVAAPIARMRGIPLVWDVFMSLYDTVVEDRGLLRAGRAGAKLLRAIEGFALRRADVLFLDTEAHARRVEALFGLPAGTAGAVWVGAETGYFDAHRVAPQPPGQHEPAAVTRVLFYGQFIPLHGIETIVEAARITRDEAIEWQLIGTGQEAAATRALLARYNLPRVHWDTWVDYAQLPARIAAADICLGIFGTSEKAASVIPNKVFQIVAMGRPLITRDSPAIRELLADQPSCVRLIDAGHADALAEAVRTLSRQRQAAAGDTLCHQSLLGKLGPDAIGEQCLSLLQNRLKPES